MLSLSSPGRWPFVFVLVWRVKTGTDIRSVACLFEIVLRDCVCVCVCFERRTKLQKTPHKKMFSLLASTRDLRVSKSSTKEDAAVAPSQHRVWVESVKRSAWHHVGIIPLWFTRLPGPLQRCP